MHVGYTLLLLQSLLHVSMADLASALGPWSLRNGVITDMARDSGTWWLNPEKGDNQGSSGFNGQLRYRSLSPISIDNFLSDIGPISDPMIGDNLS